MNYPESILYSVTAISCITGAIKVFAITKKKNNPGAKELRTVKDCDSFRNDIKEDLNEIKADVKKAVEKIYEVAVDVAKLK